MTTKEKQNLLDVADRQIGEYFKNFRKISDDVWDTEGEDHSVGAVNALHKFLNDSGLRKYDEEK